MAHPDDILIVGNMVERRDYPQFTDRQVISCSTPSRMEGRCFRLAWFSDLFSEHPGAVYLAEVIHDSAIVSGNPDYGRLARSWQPEKPAMLVEQIAALSEQNATTGRDFGRGYAKAIADVLALLVEVGLAPVEVQ